MNGIPCPSCQHTTSDVKDSRPYPGGHRRRRKCQACETTYRTVEFVVPDEGIVVIPGTGGTPPQVQSLPVWLLLKRSALMNAVSEVLRR